jgi:hypothetical protein
VRERTNRLAEAEPLMRRALAITEKSYGPEHAAALNNLAALLKDTNRLAEAESLMRRALAIDEKSLGPEHPDVAIRGDFWSWAVGSGDPRRLSLTRYWTAAELVYTTSPL